MDDQVPNHKRYKTMEQTEKYQTMANHVPNDGRSRTKRLKIKGTKTMKPFDLSIDLYLLTDFVDFYIDSGWFLDSELIENIFEFVWCTVFVLFRVIAK